MSHTKGLFVSCLLCLTILVFASSTDHQALTHKLSLSTQGSSEQILQLLLSEVRELKLAVQRSNLNTYSVLITIERVRLQQQRVDILNAQLNEIRNQLAKSKINSSKLSDYVNEIENQIVQEPDMTKRAEKERAHKIFKSELEGLTQAEQSHREREAQLNTQLQVEQAKLVELNERLETLQQELEMQQKSFSTIK